MTKIKREGRSEGVIFGADPRTRAAVYRKVVAEGRGWRGWDQILSEPTGRGFILGVVDDSEKADEGLSEIERLVEQNAQLDRRCAELVQENANLISENRLQLSEIDHLYLRIGRVRNWLRRKVEKYRGARDRVASALADAASAKSELSDLRAQIRESELERAKHKRFWASATTQARYLLVRLHARGPIEISDLLSEGEKDVEILESVCRLRVAGFIKFDALAVEISKSGVAFLAELGFEKSE
jgi:hypothetical protein